MTARRPKRATSQPVIGVATAVARMLKVIAQAISSWVADMVPCICGSRVEAISRVVAYSVEPITTMIRIRTRRPTEKASPGLGMATSAVAVWGLELMAKAIVA